MINLPIRVLAHFSLTSYHFVVAVPVTESPSKSTDAGKLVGIILGSILGTIFCILLMVFIKFNLNKRRRNRVGNLHNILSTFLFLILTVMST